MSQEYTPTTDGMRQFYVDYAFGNADSAPTEQQVADVTAEFDRWLNEVKAKAWDSGHSHCFHVEDPHNRRGRKNPYREDNS